MRSLPSFLRAASALLFLLTALALLPASFSHASPEARPIATEYETLEESDGISRLLGTLLTGRTHQIRAHLAALQHPILGDDVYGDRAFNQRRNVRRLMLCSTELTLNAGGVLSYLDGSVFRISAPF